MSQASDAAPPGAAPGTPEAISTELRTPPPAEDRGAGTPTAASDAFAVVTEPGVLVLLGLGLTGVAAARRRMKH